MILPCESRATPEADTEVVVLVTMGFVSLTTILPAATASCTICLPVRKSGVGCGAAAAGTASAGDVVLDVVGTYAVTPLEMFGVTILLVLAE